MISFHCVLESEYWLWEGSFKYYESFPLNMKTQFKDNFTLQILFIVLCHDTLYVMTHWPWPHTWPMYPDTLLLPPLHLPLFQLPSQPPLLAIHLLLLSSSLFIPFCQHIHQLERPSWPSLGLYLFYSFRHFWTHRKLYSPSILRVRVSFPLMNSRNVCAPLLVLIQGTFCYWDARHDATLCWEILKIFAPSFSQNQTYLEVCSTVFFFRSFASLFVFNFI